MHTQITSLEYHSSQTLLVNCIVRLVVGVFACDGVFCDALVNGPYPYSSVHTIQVVNTSALPLYTVCRTNNLFCLSIYIHKSTWFRILLNKDLTEKIRVFALIFKLSIMFSESWITVSKGDP